MKNRIVIAREVNVPELFFKNEGRLAVYPRRVELDGREYTFMDGLRLIIRKGQQMIQIFDMTDGVRDYRLQFDTTRRSWTLVDMTV
nr:MAG: hypothetical protein DIU68_21855 [Chloroflexota bacterium]